MKNVKKYIGLFIASIVFGFIAGVATTLCYYLYFCCVKDLL